jgi:hypothetical protein
VSYRVRPGASLEHTPEALSEIGIPAELVTGLAGEVVIVGHGLEGG